MNQVVDDFFDLPAFFAILKRQARLILLLGFVVMSCAFLFIVQTTPLYTATALVRVDPQETNLLDPTMSNLMSSSNESTRIETEVEILKSPSLALKTIAQADLQESVEFGPSVGIVDQFRAAFGVEMPPAPSSDELLAQTLTKFSNALTVRRKGLTFLVAIQFTTESPDLSASVANQHARSYIQAQITDRVDSSLAARDILQSQLKQARQSLTLNNQALQVYIEENADRLASEAGSGELSNLADQLRAATLSLGSGEDSLALVRFGIEQNDWSTLADNLGDTALQSLLEQRSALTTRLNGASEGGSEAFDLAEGLAAINLQIKDRGQIAVANLQSEVSLAQDSRRKIIESIQGEVFQGELSAQTLADVYELQQEAQIAQRQYDQLISRIRDVEAQAVLQMASSRLVSEAIVPSKASFPNEKLVLAVAILGALALGTGVALLKEFYFGGVTSSSQLSNIVPLQVSTAVPKVGTQNGTNSIADRVVKEPMSEFSEAFRKLRASVDHGVVTQSGEAQVILVTSAVPAEGKSTTALALARTYAQAGKRTLLIDADLRNPSIQKFLGEKPEYGLMDYLMHGGTDKNHGFSKEMQSGENPDAVGEFYVLDHISKLGLILGSHRANSPTDAPLQSKRFHDLIAESRATFDAVVIDSAPLLPVVDTRYIAPLADVAVLCVRFGETSQMELRAAYHHLAGALKPEANLVSTLNFYEGTQQGYKYGGYYN
ncbi:GumC family protein [Parasedimentitalea huanghaiensis]|uniref:AAA family ATPase n=1 Tax=Parasedimentitalea huanghaiensis TaxID=2682100 RepID=A0A6L6WRL2_9RHOB|nr:Wzz/FepE/Etk N-terminal domain-containing protein [Zongyanglinia huanghaiensis]MVO18577.1 AAA family ATPase [Zongyanglinia huanghaiensis]